MRTYIEDIVEAMDSMSSVGSFLNVRNGAMLTIDVDYECACRKFESLPENASDEEMYKSFGWSWDDPEFLNFLRHEEDYAALPDQYDIHEYRIMRDFSWSLDDDAQRNALLGAIQGKGAFRRFKNALYGFGIQDQWYDYKESRLLEIARAWCAENGINYAYRRPEKALAHRRFDKSQLDSIEDAPLQADSTVLHHGYFDFNWTTLVRDVKDRHEGELEIVELDVDLWASRYDCKTDQEEPAGMPLLLEISPDRRIVTPDDAHALFLSCVLVDGDRWISAAKRSGKKKIAATLVPMELHSEHICLHRREYAEYWNSEIDDILGDLKRGR